MRRSRTIAVVAALGVVAGAAQAQALRQGPAEALDGRLVRLSAGRLAATPAPSQPRFVAFYFGASWCGPCRAFVPELREAYDTLRADGVEVVFVSDDAGCRQMADYMRSSRMPWPAVACDQRERMAWLTAARGKALPGLLVYDADGRQVATSWSVGGNSRPRGTLAELRRLSAVAD